MRRWTFDLDIKLAHGQPASYWARPVNTDDGLKVIMWIRCLGGERLPTASYALCPNLNKLFFSSGSSSERRIEIFCRLFSTYQPTTHLQSRYKISPRSTRLVSGKASEYRWRSSNFHVDPWSKGREVARDVLRSLPKAENAHLLPSEMDRDFFSSIFYKPAVKCFFLRRLAGAWHISPAFV